MPNPDFAKSRLELSSGDANFLKETIPRLPCDDPMHDPITLDLNGQVLVRSREESASRPTEVLLGSSKLTGEPVILNTNRRFVERALKLGFRSVFLFGPDSPAMSVDQHRRFLWALLDKKSAIPRHDEVTRIESSAAPEPTIRPIKPSKFKERRPMTTSKLDVISAPEQPVSTAETKDSRENCSSIEQAISLRDALRSVARQVNDLVRSLKRQKRNTRLIDNTLASLKQLQKVAS
jgi:hypothetical protein